jgi:hypothetical protein
VLQLRAAGKQSFREHARHRDAARAAQEEAAGERALRRVALGGPLGRIVCIRAFVVHRSPASVLLAFIRIVRLARAHSEATARESGGL